MRVFIGYDPRQPIAFQVCAQSVWENASKPVSITRLDLRTLPIRRRGLTEFTYSRFLVPYLSGYDGFSLFLDSDILVRGDVHQIVAAAAREDCQVSVSKNKLKFEWPSVMVFNNSTLRKLTPAFIENPANKLFDWAWCERIAEMDPAHNHLVGYDPPNPNAKIVHFTKGIPIWPETRDCEFSKEWWDCCNRSNSSVSFDELMGLSVHVQGARA